jgi:DnaJ-class molecular chaperone
MTAMPSSRDYYAVLEVPKTASQDEIRKAHRKLARRYHPDINKSEDAADRFKEIQEAYDVLGDEEERKKYDRVGHRAYAAGAEHGRESAGPSPWGPGGGVRWESRGGEGFGGADFGSVIEEIFGGGMGEVGGMGGGRAAGGRTAHGARARSRPRTGQNLEHAVTIPFELALTGGKHEVKLSRGGATQTYTVTIPRGVSEGAKLRIKGAGAPSPTGGPPGDLLLTVHLADHPLLERDGLDLIVETPLSIAEATLGAEIEIPLPTGRYTITVPPGAPSGARLRLKGRGVEDEKGRRGDLYARIKIVPPKGLSEQDRALLEELGRRMPSPRTGRNWT